MDNPLTHGVTCYARGLKSSIIIVCYLFFSNLLNLSFYYEHNYYDVKGLTYTRILLNEYTTLYYVSIQREYFWNSLVFVSLRFGGRTPETVLFKPKLGGSRARRVHPRAGLFG